MKLKQTIKDNWDIGLIASGITLITYSILSRINKNWNLFDAMICMVLAFCIYMILKSVKRGD